MKEPNKSVDAPMGTDTFLISGGSFRVLVVELHSLFTKYFSLTRRLTQAKSDEELRKIQKSVSGYEREIRRMGRHWGIAPGESWGYENMERSLREKLLTPAYLVSAEKDHD